MCIDNGLSRTELHDFIGSDPNVLQVASLDLYIGDDAQPQPRSQDVFLPADRATIFVSAAEHTIIQPVQHLRSNCP